MSVASIGNSRRQHAVLVAADHAVARVAEGVDHPGVVGQHLGGEPLDAALAGGLGEVLEQQLGDAAAVVLVLDEERDLGLGVADDVVAADGDHLALQQQHQRHPLVVVDVGEARDVALGERRHRGEEPVVLRPVADPGVERDQQLGVVGRGSAGCGRCGRRAAGRRPPSAAAAPGRRRPLEVGVRGHGDRLPGRSSRARPASPVGDGGRRPGTMGAMARRTTKQDLPDDFEEHILDIDVGEEMRNSFLEYAYSVIYSRALPDARDGLKPVQRRILYTMNDMGLRPDRGHVKSARVVGEVMGRLHPHGDSAIYDALVRTAQSLVDAAAAGRRPRQLRLARRPGPAAMRYTECRMAPPAVAMTAGIDEDTVDFKPNYDGRETRAVGAARPRSPTCSSTAPPASRSAWPPTARRTTSSRSSRRCAT